MYHWYRRIATTCAAVTLLFLLAACSAPTTSARLSSNALTNAQPTATSTSTSSSSDLTLTVQPYPTPYTVYEVGSDMSHVLATGTDYMGPGDPITATINWGDQSTPTQYTFIDDRTFQIAAGHTYSKVGKYTITVTAAITIFQQSTTATGVINVVPAYTLNVNNNAFTIGRAFSGTVATGTDPFPNDTLNGTLNWGDNSASTSVQVTSSAKGSFSIKGMHTYSQTNSQTGNFIITVTLTSYIVGPITATGPANVAPSFTLKIHAITVHAGRAFQSTIGTITGPRSNAGFRVNIEWGDNTVSKMSLGSGNRTIQIRGSHDYSQAGTYTFIVIVEDLGTGQQTHMSATATVV